MQWKLPGVINPPDTICVQLELPNDDGYIDAFFGAILETASWFNWERDPLHLGAQAAARMRRMYAAIQLYNCPVPGFGTAGADEGFMLRQNPDNPCELQTSVDGVTWCTWADLSKCLPANQQVPPGKPPNPGACLEYQGGVVNGAPSILPTGLSTGDTIALVSADGASNQGNILMNWYCPSGDLYAFGSCAPPPLFDASNVVPGAPTGSPILVLGSNHYALSSTPFTIPSGFSNSPAFISLNYPTASPAVWGKVQYAVNVCKASPTPPTNWVATIDFTATQGPFAIQTDGGSPTGAWTPGTGFVSTGWFDGSNVVGIVIKTSLSVATDFTAAEMIGSRVIPSNVPNGNQMGYLFDQSATNLIPAVIQNGLPNGAFDVTGSGGAGVTSIEPFVYAFNAGSSPAGYSCILSKIILSGTGPIPAELLPYT